MVIATITSLTSFKKFARSTGGPRSGFASYEPDRCTAKLLSRVGNELRGEVHLRQEGEQFSSRMGLPQNDLETSLLGDLNEVDRPEPILVKKSIVPKRPITLGVRQVVDR